MTPRTDFERFGLSTGTVDVRGRLLLLSADVEAFVKGPIGLWELALDSWARHSRRVSMPTSIFVATEDLSVLRAEREADFRNFTAALRRVADEGSCILPHNHAVFDPAEGRLVTDPTMITDSVPGYGKRTSFFYDAVHRHGVVLGDWLRAVITAHHDLLGGDAATDGASAIFRAGGWDHGSTRDECAAYVHALHAAGVAIDSSASSGTYGEPSYRVGAPFGENVFRLSSGAVEVAPCLSVNIGVPLLSRANAGSAWRALNQPKLRRRANGALVVVVHMDHLFEARRGRRREPFGVREASTVERRVSRMFSLFARLRSLGGLQATTFDRLQDSGRELVVSNA